MKPLQHKKKEYRWRPSSRDIEQFSPKNVGLRYGIKRGFIRRVIYDNWLEILTGILIVVGICFIALVFINELPDPVM